MINGDVFTENKFVEYFVVAYAFTNHKVQGITIKQPYNIYEWHKNAYGIVNPRRSQYTGYSRTSDGDNVKIIEQPSKDLLAEVEKRMRKQWVIYKWSCLNDDCNDIYVGHTNNFAQRKGQHKKAEIKDAQLLYKAMRDNGGFERWKMEILQKFECKTRTAALPVEQWWIDDLKPSLNMCRAVKR